MKHGLMNDNITKEDINSLIEFLKKYPRLTNGQKVKDFEKSWSNWLGVQKSVMLNSGSSANMATMHILKNLTNKKEVILPPLTWISDVYSVINAGFAPVFCDVNLSNMALNFEEVEKRITDNTAAVFLTHILGFNGLCDNLLELCKEKNIFLIEDCCESHGATFKGQKIGTFGDVSNFSFYFAHHLSTIEGGMISTNNDEIYNYARMIRAHGMLRESESTEYKNTVIKNNPDAHEEFIFPVAGFNFRPNEINGVLGLSQLPRLDQEIDDRNKNFQLFLDNISDKFFKEFDIKGMSNYAFILILKDKDENLFKKLCEGLHNNDVEFRRGTSGGGNQLRQPYLKDIQWSSKDFNVVEHIHQYGMYIGNFPDKTKDEILDLCQIINKLVS